MLRVLGFPYVKHFGNWVPHSRVPMQLWFELGTIALLSWFSDLDVRTLKRKPWFVFIPQSGSTNLAFLRCEPRIAACVDV
jgi:hypothetical protein